MDENLRFGVMEMVDNPDHHKTSIFKLRVLRKMNQFLESIGFEKIGLRQLLRPEANLTTELLSVLINYKLYMYGNKFYWVSIVIINVNFVTLLHCSFLCVFLWQGYEG